MPEAPPPSSPITSVERLPTSVVVHLLAGELGKSEVDALCSDVDKAQTTAASLPFILDMSSIRFAGSLAMGVLVGLNQEFRTRGQRLIFVGLQSNVHEAIKMLRIHQIVEIMPDVPKALQSLAEPTSGPSPSE